MSALRLSISGALHALRRRPAVRILALVWSVQVVGFAYALSYLLYKSAPEETAELLAGLMPARAADFVIGSLPLYGGPVLVILGAVVSGSGGLVTLLPRFPDRGSFLVGRFVALSVVTAGYAVLTLVLAAVSSLSVALAEGSALVWPGPLEWVRGFAVIWLVMTAFAGLGAAIGVLTKSLPVAIAVGLLWTPGAESVLALVTGGVEALHPVRAALLSPSAGSLAAALGSSAPGVAAVSAPGVAVAVLAGWIVVPLLVSLLVFNRRDVT
ncbi:hypothetical protein AB0C33_37510 [Nonomuraea sp. NPDC048881]|uniref:hypothetical protein n=1 Tax=Nonomuraea sp. NPDC048881 TaxID=3155030 RepID=UPI0033D2B2C4